MKVKIFLLLVMYLSLLSFATFSSEADTAGANTASPIMDSTLSLTATTTPTLTLTPTPTPLPTITYEQLLSVHESVLETTKWSVTAVLSVITALGCLGSFVMSGFTLVGGATGLVAYRRISDAAKRADVANVTVDRLNKSVDDLGQQTDHLVQQTKAALQDAQDSSDTAARVQGDLVNIQGDIERFKTGMRGDIEDLRKSLLLVQIEERSIELYSDELEVQERAIRALKVMVTPERPAFVRRHVVRLLGSYAVDYQDRTVAEWLEEVAQNDSAASVRSTALYELRDFKPPSREQEDSG